MKRNSKIYIAGHKGMVGSALVRCLETIGFSNLIVRTHSELNLERQADVEAFFKSEKPEFVFLAAAKVGGIWANDTSPAEFIYNNLIIQTNMLHAAWRSKVKRLLFLGSSCIYPRECPQPIKEEYLLTDKLEPTNEPYAIAKIAGVKMCHAYNRQYDVQFIPVMPTNLYGPNDNYDLKSSHVLPALIRKFHLAKLAENGNWKNIERDEQIYGSVPNNFFANLVAISEHQGYSVPPSVIRNGPCAKHSAAVTLWGSGSPYREFLHVEDLADACVLLMNLSMEKIQSVLSQNFNPAKFFDRRHTVETQVQIRHSPLINIGYGKDVTIKELADTIKEIIGFKGELEWDHTKPDGIPRKLLEVSRINALGWKPKIPLVEGIESTYGAYSDQYMK